MTPLAGARGRRVPTAVVAIGILALAGFVALSTPAAAQEEGCTEASPCPWVLNLDENGFGVEDDAEASPLRTVGDWFFLDVQNFDEEAHSLSLEDSQPPVLLLVPGLYDDSGGQAISAAFTFPEAGTYMLLDETTGDELEIEAIDEDAALVQDIADESDAEEDEPKKKSPAPMVAVLALSVLGLVAIRRR